MKRLLVACVLVACQTSSTPTETKETAPVPARPVPAPVPSPGPAPATPPRPSNRPTDGAYARDITNLCNALTLAPGLDTARGNDRQIVIAMWLGKVLETQASRDWLAEIQPLQGQAKADALQSEAKRVGLDDCALAAEWR